MFHPNELQDEPKAPSKFNWAMFDEELFLYWVIIIEPILLFAILLAISKHALLIFIAIGILIEIVASRSWVWKKTREPALAAFLAGIFWAGALVVALFLLASIAILVYVLSFYILPFVVFFIPLLLPSLAYGRLGLNAVRFASQPLKPVRVTAYAFAGGAGTILIAALCAGSYYYLRPEIDQIPVFVTASDVESTDWQSWDSGFSIERNGRFITTASPEEVLNSYNNKLTWQGWRLVDEDIDFSGLDKTLTQVCCYSYWSGNGRETLLSIGYTQTSQGTLVQINLKKH